jgi:multiple sugar transport system substrate-binding protein
MYYKTGVALAAACSSAGKGSGSHAKGCDGKVSDHQTVTAWFHTGTGAERDTLNAQVKAFNTSQSKVTVKVTLLPQGNYDDQVKAAASAGKLPNVLDFDGPLLFNYAWNHSIIPLDTCINPAMNSDLLPDIVQQGTYSGHLYGVGTFDSGLGLYARRSVLEKVGARIPTSPADAWTAAEFTQILKKLQADGWAKPLDLQIQGGAGEFFTYAYSPILQSVGADLIDRKTYHTADGILNGPAAVQAMTTFQSWFKDGLVNPNPDGNAFPERKAAISWIGHWVYADYRKAFGNDLVILPLPNFGQGSRTGSGSWQWGITPHTGDPDAAWAFINYLLQPHQVLQMSDANGGPPATKSAVAQSPQFGSEGPEHLYIEQLQDGTAVPRPQTPAYPTITTAFAKAMQDIINGGNVKSALDTAVSAIDQDLKDNDYYPVS